MSSSRSRVTAALLRRNIRETCYFPRRGKQTRATMEIASFTDPCEGHFHIFMPSSFPLKAARGRVYGSCVARGVWCARHCVLKWINRARQESCWQGPAMPQSEMTVGWANGTGGGWGLTARGSLRWSPPHPHPTLYLLPLFSLFFFSFLWFLLTKNRLGGHFAHWWITLFFFFHFHFALKPDMRSCPTAMD